MIIVVKVSIHSFLYFLYYNLYGTVDLVHFNFVALTTKGDSYHSPIFLTSNKLFSARRSITRIWKIGSRVQTTVPNKLKG